MINKGWCINGVQGTFSHTTVTLLWVSSTTQTTRFNSNCHSDSCPVLVGLGGRGYIYKVPKKLECQSISVQVCFLAERLVSVSVHLRQASERPITIDKPWFVHQWRSTGHWVESSVGEINVPSRVSLHQTNQLSVILVLPVFASTPEWDTVEAGI